MGERESKRFFRMVDDEQVEYIVVAIDRPHAEQFMRDSGVEFGDPSVSYDAAVASGILEWSEMTEEQVARRKRCHTEDERGVIPLSDAVVGDWFCSEW